MGRISSNSRSINSRSSIVRVAINRLSTAESLTNGSLEQNVDAVKEEEVPNPSYQFKVKGSGKEGHEPFEQVLLRLDVLQLKVLAEFGKIVRKQLLVDLHDFPDEHIIEGVKGHDWVLGHHVAEGDKALVLVVHKEQKRGSNITHSLHIADVRSIHRERLENSVQLCVVDAVGLEDAAQFREGPGDVSVDDQDASFPCLMFLGIFLFHFWLDIYQHSQLLPDFERVPVDLLEFFHLLESLCGIGLFVSF